LQARSLPAEAGKRLPNKAGRKKDRRFEPGKCG